jgi:tetratricopeptide (TPR) repeat protein
MNTKTMKSTLLMLLAVFTMVLTGCSSDYLRDDYKSPRQRGATPIPEINQHRVIRSPRQTAKPRPARPRAVVKPYRPQNNPQIKKYTITSSTTTNPQNVDAVDRAVEAKKQASVEIDPYASIPENNAPVAAISKPQSSASPAVKSLLARARADLSVGRTQSAVSKLERGLRIESQNPSIWHLLAKAQHDQANHQQAISMAKKSIRYSDDDNLTAQNWKLIQKAGEKSDDAIAIKEALDYFKVNP